MAMRIVSNDATIVVGLGKPAAKPSTDASIPDRAHTLRPATPDAAAQAPAAPAGRGHSATRVSASPPDPFAPTSLGPSMADISADPGSAPTRVIRPAAPASAPSAPGRIHTGRTTVIVPHPGEGYPRAAPSGQATPSFHMGTAAPLPRRTLLAGRYRVLQTRFTGGISYVYQCLDEKTAQYCMIKELFAHGHCSRDDGLRVQFNVQPDTLETLRNAFLSEIRVLMRLEHPGIARITDFFEANGTLYHCSELTEGESLARVVEANGQVSLQTALSLFAQLAATLGFIHERGLIHRDVKPSNVFILKNKLPLLTDFGAARDVMSPVVTPQMFTPDFAAPESTAPPYLENTWTDVYALFSTIHYALTGQPVNAGEPFDPAAFPRSDELSDKANDDLAAFFAKGLAEEFENRFQTMAAAADALHAVQAQIDEGYSGARIERRKIFISYAREDETFALDLYEFLTARGYEAWIDQKSIRGGMSWAEQVNRGIDGSDVFVIVCSPNSVSRTRTSENVMRELTLATDCRKPLVPVFRETTELSNEAKFFLSRVQWTMIDGSAFDPVVESLASIF